MSLVLYWSCGYGVPVNLYLLYCTVFVRPPGRGASDGLRALEQLSSLLFGLFAAVRWVRFRCCAAVRRSSFAFRLACLKG